MESVVAMDQLVTSAELVAFRVEMGKLLGLPGPLSARKLSLLLGYKSEAVVGNWEIGRNDPPPAIILRPGLQAVREKIKQRIKE